MRVLLAPHGTRGDIQPVLAPAIELRARGHLVRFPVPPGFPAWNHKLGFEAVSTGGSRHFSALIPRRSTVASAA